MRTSILLIISLWLLFSLDGYSQSPDINTIIREGMELHDEGEYEEAIDRYLEALDIDSTSMLAFYELSLSYLALGDQENTLLYSTRVIESGHESLAPGAYAVKSEVLAKMEQVDEAIALLQDGLSKYGDEYLLHFNLALNYHVKGDIEKTLQHVKRAIDIDKTHSGAFLLYAYVLNDKGLWIQSILSFQMFLLLEPDSQRSRNAFEELLQTMQLRKKTEPVERSFVQLQLMRNQPDSVGLLPDDRPPLGVENGLDRDFVYNKISTTIDSLQNSTGEVNEFLLFQTVNKAIMDALEKESWRNTEGIFWTFYVPFFSRIAASNYYETFCRYISVSYYTESYEWWQENPGFAENFITWFEKGEPQ